VTRAKFDEEHALWRVTIRRTDGGFETVDGNAVITAVGQLNRPALPPIDGLDRFCGPVFHTARSDKSVELKGKRVAMIGTGASGMQTGSSIAPEVAHLTVFQRTPHWAMNNRNYPQGGQFRHDLGARTPALLRAMDAVSIVLGELRRISCLAAGGSELAVAGMLAQ
jgi:cation diffusion facilitator CzcD-associated flavoprotein CzcO